MANPPFANYQSNPAAAIPVYTTGPGGVGAVPLGFEQITGLGTAQPLTPPLGATYAVISPEGQGVRWRDDGTAPTATVGMPVAVNTVFTYGGDLTAIEFIQQSATATLNVSYYR